MAVFARETRSPISDRDVARHVLLSASKKLIRVIKLLAAFGIIEGNHSENGEDGFRLRSGNKHGTFSIVSFTIAK